MDADNTDDTVFFVLRVIARFIYYTCCGSFP